MSQIAVLAQTEKGIRLQVDSKIINVFLFYGVRVNVLCENAAHKVWRGGGRMHESFAAAKSAYKSTEMKAAIDYAENVLLNGGK